MRGEESRRRAAAVATLAVVLGLGLLVSSSGVVPVIGAPYRDLPIPVPTPSQRSVRPTIPGPDPSVHHLATPLRLVVLALLATLVLAGLVLIWRGWVWRRHPRVAAATSAPGVAEAVLADAHDQLAELRCGTPTNAIVRCWQRLEAAIARAGRPAYPWETPTEVTEAVLRDFDVDPGAVADLLDLYREARFSDHPLGEPDRDRALAALMGIHAGLDRHTVDRRADDSGPLAPLSPTAGGMP
ncbi:MAG: DUF4129 domain-containing protein [Tetrasphaera sp.]|nr:DUF4129 domain-containing protein [Tetrasphaera sp.]